MSECLVYFENDNKKIKIKHPIINVNRCNVIIKQNNLRLGREHVAYTL